VGYNNNNNNKPDKVKMHFITYECVQVSRIFLQVTIRIFHCTVVLISP